MSRSARLLPVCALVLGVLWLLPGAASAGAAPAPVVAERLYIAAGLMPADKPRNAPEFILPRLDGATVRLSDYRGKLVVLNFWATWCRPCVKEMPALERLSHQMQNRNLVVLAISLDRDPAPQVSMFVEGYGWKLPILLDPDAEAGGDYLVSAMPSTFLIGPDGVILARALGPREWDDADSLALFNALLAPQAALSTPPAPTF